MLGRRGVGGREIVLEGAAHFEAQVGGEAGERALDRHEAVALGVEIVVARAELGGGDAEEVALVAVGEQGAGAATQVVREGARVAAEHGAHEVGAAADAAIGVIERDAVDEPQVAQHAEQREERERDEAVRLLAGDALDQLEDLRRADAVELGAKLQRQERVEERALRDLAHARGEVRVEEAEVEPREAEQAGGDLDQVGEAVAEDDQAGLGRVLVHRGVQELGARGVLGEHGLEITLENEGSIAIAEHGARELDDARHAVARQREVLAKVEADDRLAAPVARVVARVGEAGDALEQDLQLEERVFFLVGGEARVPRLARLLLLATEPARVAQELGVGVAAGRSFGLRRRGRGLGRHREARVGAHGALWRTLNWKTYVNLVSLPLGEGG